MSPNSNRPQDWPGQDTDNDQNSEAYGDNQLQNTAPAAAPSANNAYPAPQQSSNSERPQAQFGPSNSTNPGFSTPIDNSHFDELPAAQPNYNSSAFVQKRRFWTKRKKVVLGVLATTLLLLLAGGGAAFAYYNNSTKVVGDAISNAILADSGQIKGDAKFDANADGRQMSATLNYDVKSNEKLMQADLALDVNVAPMSFDFSGGVIADVEGNYYFKIDNAKQIYQNIFGATPDSVDPSMDGVNTIIEMLDNKWVKVSKEDFQESMSEEEKTAAECSEKLSQDLTNNKQLTRELTEKYKQNVFINDEKLDSDDFNTLHYKLTFDEQKAKDFVTAFGQTELYKRIKACDKEFEIKQDDVADAVKAANKANIEVWIDRWSHQFKKVTITGKADETNYSVTANTTFDQPVSIEVPQNPTPFKDIMAEFEKMSSSFYGGFEDVEYEAEDQDLITAEGDLNSSVMGDRDLRLFPWQWQQ